MQNQFSKQFESHIKFIYTFFDRIIVRGYIAKLFDTGQAIYLLRSLGFDRHTNGVFRLLTDQLNSHIQKIASNYGLPILWRDNLGKQAVPEETNSSNNKKNKKSNRKKSQKKPKKEEIQMQSWVEENYLKPNVFGVLCIIKGMENVKTLWNKEITTKEGKTFTKMYWCQKPVSQYYIYFNDKTLGLCYLKISSYFPFYCEFYCNGHQYLKREFEKRNIPFKMEDNSFIEIGDLETTEELIENFSGTIISQRIEKLWDEWFNFHKGERSRRNDLLQHQWYSSQVEVCSNVIFKSSHYFNSLFDRFVEKHHRIGLPESLSKIFDLKQSRKHSETSQKLYDQKVCIKHWIESNSIKMYNKGGYLLRVETTINNPGLPRAILHKPIEKIKGYYWYGHQCNNRYLEALSEIDISSISENTDQYTQPIVSQKGKKVAAPDLRKKEQMKLVETLLNTKFVAEWFSIKVLFVLLSSYYSKPAKIRYQLQKFIERGMIEKRKGTNYYRVTRKGYSWFFVSYCQYRYFVNPLQSTLMKKELDKKLNHPDGFEQAYENLHKVFT